MSNDVLITPASRKIEFKDSSGNVDGKIELDSAGNLVLTSPGGGIELGDSSSDIFVGNGSANIDIIFEQNGEIRGTTGRTVTLGQNDSNITVDALNFTTSTSTLFKSQSGITSNRTGIGTSTPASTDISSYTAPHTIESTNPGSTQYALLATLPATGNATLDHIVIEGDMGIWNDTHSFRIKMGRRDGFKYDYTIFDHNPTFSRASIVAYQASNGTVTIHAKLTASQYGMVTYTITHSYQVTVVDKPSLTTSTPAGTLIFDSDDTSTYPPTMRFPDNQKLEFGAAADLRIYHDGSNSIIEDNGTGSLQLKGAVNINGAYTLPAADGNNAQVLATNGSGTISFQSVGSLAGSGIQNVSDDTSPQLGGNLSTATNEIHISQTSGVGIKTTGNLSSSDLTLLRASSASSQDGQYGFDIKYMGSRSGNANSFALEMHNQNGTNVEAITVYQDGKVGINKTAPTAPLHVGGTSTFDDVATFSEGATVTGGSSGDVLLTFATDRSWQFQQSGDDASTRLQLKANTDSKSFDIISNDSSTNFSFFTSNSGTPQFTLGQNAVILFEGASDDAYETTLTVTDPTADRTITLPNATGTVSLVTATETLTNKTLTSPTVTSGLALSNSDITGVNSLYFNDPGSGEGLRWNGGNMKLFESPDNLSNAAGNLQVTYNDARRFTVSNSGAEVVGTLTTSGGITFSDGTTQTSAGASTGFSIAMATALG